MDCGIYKITCTTTGKFYIGSSSEIKRRWVVHKYRLKHGIHINPYLQSVYNKYGLDSFLFEIIEEVEDKNNLLKIEQEWLDRTKSFDRTIGYNLTNVAGGGALTWKSWIITDPEGNEFETENLQEFCRKNNLSAGQMGNIALRQAKTSHKGYFCRPANLSKEEWENTPYKVKQYKDKNGKIRKERIPIYWKITYPDGNEIIIENLTKFCKENNMSIREMLRVSSGRKETYHGFKCENITKPKIKTGETKKERSGFIVTAPDGTEITTYNLEEFIREHNLTPRLLHAIANGKGWSNKGYTCRKVGDPPRTREFPVKYIAVDINGEETPIRKLEDFCEEKGLNKRWLYDTLFNGHKHKNYFLKRYQND